MIELESYMAPVPILHGSRGTQARLTRRRVALRPAKLEPIKGDRRRSSRKRGSWFVSLLAYLS
jgi:hypothetical protein